MVKKPPNDSDGKEKSKLSNFVAIFGFFVI